MVKNVNDEKLYKELREMFNYYCELIDTTDACINWWLIAFDIPNEFMGRLAEIIVKYVKTDEDSVNILVERELRNICNYARAIRNRMYDLELANYTRDKFLNDLIDAIEAM